MRRLAIVLGVAIATSSLAGSPASAGVCTDTIQVADFSFTPSTRTRGVQDNLFVCWHNNGPTSPHTATSDTGMFDTGTIANGADDSAQLFGSGRYPYHCTIHPFMTATFKVRPIVGADSITRGEAFTLTVGDRGMPADVSWDVQKKRNDGPWITFKTGTARASFAVRPSRTGTFRYRARTHLLGNVSGWSPPRRVVVHPA